MHTRGRARLSLGDVAALFWWVRDGSRLTAGSVGLVREVWVVRSLLAWASANIPRVGNAVGFMTLTVDALKMAIRCKVACCSFFVNSRSMNSNCSYKTDVKANSNAPKTFSAVLDG